MCLINSFQIFMIRIAILFHTTGALRSCKNFNIYLSGIDETPIDTLNQSSCELLKDLANQCGSVTLEIELDEYVSKYYEESHGISIQVIQTNITLLDTDIFNNSAIVGVSEKSDTNVPVVVLISLASIASGSVITYFLAEKIKTMLQSGSYSNFIMSLFGIQCASALLTSKIFRTKTNMFKTTSHITRLKQQVYSILSTEKLSV